MDELSLLQQQITQLQEELNRLKQVPVEPIVPTVIYASEGKVLRRSHDYLLMGERVTLGYDYSLGFRRVDKPEFYIETDPPETN